MKVLESTVESLSSKEYDQLTDFIKCKPSKRKRKDLLLLELIRSKKVGNQVTTKDVLGVDPKSNAFHALRKRLLKLVMHFLHVSKIDKDYSIHAEVEHLITFAKFWAEKGDRVIASKFLSRASKMANDHQFYWLLERIHRETLFFGELSLKDIERLAADYTHNQFKKEQRDRVDLALSFLLTQVSDSKKNGRSLPYQLIVDHTLRKFELENSAVQNPQILLQIIEVIRATIKTRKDYFEFEKYLEAINTSYFSFINFSEKDHFYYYEILYITAHTYYKNRKFDRGLSYSEKLFSSTNKHEDKGLKREFGKHVLLHASLMFYGGKLDSAIKVLEDVQQLKFQLLDAKEQNYTLLNLGYYFYCKGNFEIAQKYICKLKHTDNWYEKKVGEEWALKKGILEVIIFFDLDQHDKSFSKIDSLSQNHERLLADKRFSEIASFLQLTKRLILEPDFVFNSPIDQLLDDSFLSSEKEDELQSLIYYSWFKSKKYQRSFYQTLLKKAYRDVFSFI